MLLTEEEAKKRWCPHVIASHTDPRGKFGAEGAYGHACIGSACMAWRKQESAAFAHHAEAQFQRTGARLESTEGFCGLAGRPT